MNTKKGNQPKLSETTMNIVEALQAMELIGSYVNVQLLALYGVAAEKESEEFYHAFSGVTKAIDRFIRDSIHDDICTKKTENPADRNETPLE